MFRRWDLVRYFSTHSEEIGFVYDKYCASADEYSRREYEDRLLSLFTPLLEVLACKAQRNTRWLAPDMDLDDYYSICSVGFVVKLRQAVASGLSWEEFRSFVWHRLWRWFLWQLKNSVDIPGKAFRRAIAGEFAPERRAADRVAAAALHKQYLWDLLHPQTETESDDGSRDDLDLVAPSTIHSDPELALEFRETVREFWAAYLRGDFEISNHISDSVPALLREAGIDVSDSEYRAIQNRLKARRWRERRARQ